MVRWASMTLYGPLTAQNYLDLLKNLASDSPDERMIFEETLRALLETFQAERGFLLKVSENGGLRVLLSRNHEGQTVKNPRQCLSHFALQKAIESEEGFHIGKSVQSDRRYRSESFLEGHRQPRSIIVFTIQFQGQPALVIYLDHRFKDLTFDAHQATLIEHWLTLLELSEKIAQKNKTKPALSATDRKEPQAVLPKIEAPGQPKNFHGFWSCSRKIDELFQNIQRLATSKIPVLIQGETGTGKGLLARALHEESSQSGQPFLSINCGAISETLIESELFGHVQGAFTGAESEHIGMLQQAHGGTLFIDEVTDMSDSMQKKLIRFLEEGRFRPIGGKEEIQVDVRLLSATRLDLNQQIESGRFRADLYYRLCGVRLKVPPLREHLEDVCGLADRFSLLYAEEFQSEVPLITDEGREWLIKYSWPGNVRELENVMRQLVALGVEKIGVEEFSNAIWKGQGGRLGGFSGETLDEAVERAEREAVEKALGLSAGNKSRAAEILGVTRKSLYRRLSKYDLGHSIDAKSWLEDTGEGAVE